MAGTAVVVALLARLTGEAPAAQTTITKADTTTMNLAADWGGTPPVFGDIGVLDSTISAVSAAALTLNGGVNLDELLFTNTLNGPVTIATNNPPFTLTLGAVANPGAAIGIDMSSANYDATLNCAVAMGTNNNWNVTAGRTLTVNGVLSGAKTVNLTKSGAGTLILTGANTYGGITTNSGGTLQIGNGGTSGNLGASNVVVTAATGSSMLAFNRIDPVGSPLVVSNQIVGSSGKYPYIVVNSGAVQLSGTNDNGYATADVKSGATLILAKASTSGVHALGTATSTVESGGTLQLAGTGNFQIYPSVTVTVQSGGVLDFNGRTNGLASLNLAGTGISSGGAFINSAAATTATYSNGVALTDNSSIGGAGNLSILGGISGASYGITKVGGGTLTLSGANTYNGPTAVSAGKLVTTTTSSFSSSGFSIADGATNQVVVASQGSTLNENSLTLGTSTGATLEFNNAGFANPTTPIVTVNNPNPVVLNGTVTVNVYGTNFLATAPGSPIVLMSYPSGETINSGGGFVLGSLPFGVSGYLTDNLNELDLIITSSSSSLTWNGNMGNVWDVNDTGNGNWYNQPGNIAGAYYSENASLGLPVAFNDTATGSTSITLDVTAHPAGVTINNSALNYSITGAGSIAGPLALVKNGTGTFTIGVANNFTNPIINSGKLGLTNANNVLPVTDTVTFGGPATLDLGGNGQALTNLSFGGLTAGTATVSNGNLTITGGNWNPQPNAADTAVTTEDLSGLATLTYTTGSQLFFQGALGANSTNKLAGTNNFTLSALWISSGGLTAATATYTESVLLGQSNLINTASIQLGGYHNCGSFLGFNPRLTSPTLTLRGQSGGVTPVGNLYIGANNNGTFPPSTFDTTAGSLDAIVNNFYVVYSNSGGFGTPTGTMSMSNGTLNVGAVYVNFTLGVSQPFTATFNQNGGTVLAGTLAFNTNTTTGAATYTSAYNLGKGTAAGLLAAQAILIASDTTAPNTSSRATLNFLNGTIENYDPALGQPGSAGAAVGSYATAQNLTISGLTGGGAVTNDYRTLNIVLAATGAHNFYAESGYLITEQSTALISGSGGLTANGAGTLVLSGANTYTGGTTISGGTLEADNNKALGTGLLTLSGGALSNNFSSTLTNYVNLSSAATVGVGATQTLVLGGIITNTGALTKAGSGTLVLTNGNTYTGNTTISAGTLALRGSASLVSPLISVADGASFDVSGLNSLFVLGVSQTLSNNASGTGIINSNLSTASGTVAISYVANTPAFIITNGTLTLSANTVFNINNTGSTLNSGSYTIITNATTGSPGAVAGIAPTNVTVVGNGLASGATASLQITNGALALVVVGGGPSLTIPTLTNSISIGSTNLTFSWAADHIGYRLLVQTNHLAAGVSSNTNDWGTVAGSTTTNQVTVPINDILPTEFYRLVYP